MIEYSSAQDCPFILVVEDSKAIVSELQRKFDEQSEFRAEFVATYAAASKFLNENSSEIFLAILDLNLPDSQDGEIVDLFCKYKIPSIIFTADFDESTRKQMLSKDIIDYVVKDVHGIDSIVNYIRRLRQNCETGVLVVDDSDSFRFGLCKMLNKLMFRVEQACDGETALAMIEGGIDVKLAVVDYEMPGMNGVELVKKIRSIYSRDKLAIIGLSSSEESMLTAKFIKSGANDFLYKPFEVEEFYCRVRSTMETLELIDRLKDADRFKNEFLGMAVHDMRSPISGIKGFSQLLLDDLCGELSDEQRDIIGVISSANLQMNEMVSDLLDISAIEAGKLRIKRESGDLKGLVEDRIRIHSIAARKKSIGFVPNLSVIPQFKFDVRRVGQVLDNLLTNAVKFSPAGNKVDITICRHGGSVEICVRDYGQGIPPDQKDFLFQSFKKTRVRPTAGESSTGLGLHIVKKIVEGHGGTVWVESEFGAGAAFYFSLPMSLL